MGIRFKAVHGGGIFPMNAIYEPKTRKKADEIMALHRSLGDSILILEDEEEDGNDEVE